MEKVPIVDLGIIAKGPGLMRRPIAENSDAFAMRSGETTESPCLSSPLCFQADWAARILKVLNCVDQKARVDTIVFIEVPTELVQSRDPLAGLIVLLDGAVAFARAHGRNSSSQLDEILDRLKQVANPVGGSILAGDRGLSAASKTPPPGRVVVEEPRLEVSLPIPDEAALGEAFQFERLLDDSLKAAAAGHVDGNEAGDGEFVIFAYGPSIERLRAVVDDEIRRHWSGGNARTAAFEDSSIDHQ